MRKKKGEQAAEATGEGGGKPPKEKGKLLPATVIALGLVGGGYFMGGKGGESAAAGARSETTTTTVALGKIVRLDPITLNLADGRFLKLGLALQMPEEAKGGGGHGATDAEAEQAEAAKALDEAIAFLGDKTYAELAAPGGRTHAKEELSKRVAERYHDEVLGVYFTEFVMQ